MSIIWEIGVSQSRILLLSKFPFIILFDTTLLYILNAKNYLNAAIVWEAENQFIDFYQTSQQVFWRFTQNKFQVYDWAWIWTLIIYMQKFEC